MKPLRRRDALRLFAIPTASLLTACGGEQGADGISRPVARTRDLLESEKLCGARVDDGVLSVCIPECDGDIWFTSTRRAIQSSTAYITNSWWGLKVANVNVSIATLSKDSFDESSGSYDPSQSMYIAVRSDRVSRNIFWLGTDESVYPKESDEFVNGAGDVFSAKLIAEGGYTCSFGDGSLF